MIIDNFTKLQIFKFKMEDGRHIGKHHFGHNSAVDCAIFVKFCTKIKNLKVMTAKCKKLQTLKIQDG